MTLSPKKRYWLPNRLMPMLNALFYDLAISRPPTIHRDRICLVWNHPGIVAGWPFERNEDRRNG